MNRKEGVDMKHTPEPWMACESGYITRVEGGENVEEIADVIYSSNAARIVACVNACAGLTDEELEDAIDIGGLRVVIDMIEGVAQNANDRTRAIQSELRILGMV